ncbi:MAG: hypothetical protein GWO02_01405, partial [Gammaproteobacteria bacterium]|nr:hypothetical protein [Gammaproteobacteria bacterium]
HSELYALAVVQLARGIRAGAGAP